VPGTSIRMENGRVEKISDNKLHGRRKVGRPRLR
jgi:hypothetical protein